MWVNNIHILLFILYLQEKLENVPHYTLKYFDQNVLYTDN